MSGLAGIFKFDPRDRVSHEELMALAHGLDRIGPDGGAEQLTKSVGMAYRAFHTTPESHWENQPVVRSGCVLTWDGRLDNREEILSKVERTYDETPTDVELVLAAYENWGTACFAELLGDWALALWDERKRQLTLARDYIGVRRLFYRLDVVGVAWCTTLEPLVLTARHKLHLDCDYLAGCLYPRPPVDTTPYQEIRSVVPASCLTFQYGGKQAAQQYWSLNPHAKIRYTTDSEYEAHFRDVFRVSVSRRLRADRAVLAELSGGLDSSSIVCMADDIRSRRPGVAIETFSYYDTDEPSGDERPYFTLVEQKRGHTGHHISVSDFTRQTADDAWMSLPNECFAASPGYSARSLRWESAVGAIQAHAGTRVILSGLGGDEVLGGVQYEAPELADHLLSGKLISLAQSTFRWSLAKKKTIYRLLGDTFELILASYRPDSLVATSAQPLPWTHLKPLTHHRALRTFSHWRDLPPLLLCMESVRYCLAQQLTCTDPPLTGCVEKRYPYLDRRFFAFLASIPRTQVLQSGRRRHLMRRALRGLVPDEVLFRKTKWFGFRRTAATFSGRQPALDALFEDKWLSDRVVVDSAMLQKHMGTVQHGAPDEGTALRSAIGIEQWLRTQFQYGTVEFALPGNDRVIALEHVEPPS